MAEDLGFIEVRIPELNPADMIRQSKMGRSSSGDDDDSGDPKKNKIYESMTKGMQKTFGKFGSIKDLLGTAAQGGSLRDILAGGQNVATQFGGKTGAMIGAAAAGVGVIVGVAVAMKAFVSHILDRVTELARINALMAKEAMANKLAELTRDMKEARALGPMYATVSSIWRGIQNNLQPLILYIKTSLMIQLIPILKIVETLLKGFNVVFGAILKAISSVIHVIAKYLDIASQLTLHLAKMIPAYMDPFGFTSGLIKMLGETGRTTASSLKGIATTLDSIHSTMKQTTPGSSIWALGALQHMATSHQGVGQGVFGSGTRVIRPAVAGP